MRMPVAQHMHPLRLSLALVLSLLTTTGHCIAQEPPTHREFRIVGYLPDYRMPDFDLTPCRVLTDLYVFSAEVSPDGALLLNRLEKAPWTRLQTFKTMHRVRLVLCIGGWERSSGFGPMAMSAQARKRFLENVRTLCLEKRLDGIDLDWEHPQNEREQEAYGELLCELAETLRPLGLQVSVTMASWQIVPRAGLEAVDAVNIMSYDHNGRHSTLEDAATDIEKIIAQGAAARQMSLGVPFYGRSISNRNQAVTWSELAEKAKPGSDEHEGFYFNGPETIRRKTRMAVDRGLGGIMIWELGQDAKGQRSLLTAIHDEAHRSTADTAHD